MSWYANLNPLELFLLPFCQIAVWNFKLNFSPWSSTLFRQTQETIQKDPYSKAVRHDENYSLLFSCSWGRQGPKQGHFFVPVGSFNEQDHLPIFNMKILSNNHQGLFLLPLPRGLQIIICSHLNWYQFRGLSNLTLVGRALFLLWNCVVLTINDVISWSNITVVSLEIFWTFHWLFWHFL